MCAQSDLEAAQREGLPLTVHVAFSRGTGPPRYVQELLTDQRERVAALVLRTGAAVYVCGYAARAPRRPPGAPVRILRAHARGTAMGRAVREAVERALGGSALLPTGRSAAAEVEALERAGRYVAELWTGVASKAPARGPEREPSAPRWGCRTRCC